MRPPILPLATNPSLVPLMLDAVASRLIAVLWRHEPEQTAGGAVAKEMTPRLDLVANLDVFLLHAVPEDPHGPGGFERPRGRLPALRVLDFDVDPRMREEVVDFRDRPLDGRPHRDFVSVVRMVRPRRQRPQHHQHRAYGRKAQDFPLHGHPPTFKSIRQNNTVSPARLTLACT